MLRVEPAGGTNHVLRRLRALVGGGRERVLYECRHCGSTLDAAGEECPDCGAAEVARLLL